MKHTLMTLLMIGGLTLPAAAVPTDPVLDELLDIKPVAPQKPAQVRPPGDVPFDPLPRPKQPLDRQVLRDLTIEEVTGVFEQAVRLMDNASERLGLRLDPGLATQRVQESIMAKLDQVIEDANCKSCQSGGQGQPGQPQNRDAGSAANAAKRSAGASQANQPNQGTLSPGGVERLDPNMTPLEQLRREWGHLPPRLRGELRQGLGEPFSPVYKSQTEAYFRRLAEQGR